MGYSVSIGEYVRTKTPYAKKPYRCKSRTKFQTGSESEIAERAVSVLRDAGPGMRYSGMEDFGEAHDFWNDGHECPEDGSYSAECEALELDACREWIEKATAQLGSGESEELHLSQPDWFIGFAITCK